MGCLLSACSSDTGSKASIQGGEYSGVSVGGQPVVIDVVGVKVRVNSVDAFLDDPTTNAAFTVDVSGTREDFTCTNGDDGHTLSCAVKRSRQLQVKVPCSLVEGGPSTGASATATPTASPPASTPSASAQAAVTSAATTSLCPETLPNTETLALLHLCSTAPCPDQSNS